MKYIITFAGPVGSSKTPISHYLSETFNLPIFNNDSIRTEVLEDLSEFSQEEFLKRLKQRLTTLIESGNSFILDASMDREFKNYQEKIYEYGYQVFIISLDLSRDFLTKLYEVKKYSDALSRIDQLLTDHQNFLSDFSSKVNLSLDDSNFINRLSLCEKSLISWLNENKNVPVKEY
jgi:predicted kinase